MKTNQIILMCLFLLTASDFHAKNNTTMVQVAKPLSQLQQEFLDLRFGMFIHFNIATFSKHDWPDPNQLPETFNPTKLDCCQWADAAALAGMTYGCLTTKHHSGFCIWPTKTTDYNVMNSPCKRDVVKEYVDAFRKKGLKVFLYYSILDTHHNIRPRWINKSQTQLIKDQLTELFTNYGEISALVIDGWDAGWSRISYEDIPFEEIYRHVKSLQPNCIISEHNAGKYPSEYLFYTDVKHYEQNAGQIISRETNNLPAQAGIPINKNWFWKDTFPFDPVKSAKLIVEDNLVPLNEAHCNFILNVAPNPDGLIDENVISELKKVGQLWKNPGPATKLPFYQKPVVASNLAKGKKMDSSWSEGTAISDKANDDNFSTCWSPSVFLQQPYLEVIFDQPTEINSVGFVELDYKKSSNFITKLKSYDLEYWDGAKWQSLGLKNEPGRVRIYRFNLVKTTKVRLLVNSCVQGMAIAELMVYNEKL